MNTNTASEVKVQVVCVTYNQKDYIKEALDSFLMQKTNFKFEVLVGDDCSTDGTSEIVAEYAKKYPDIIKHIRRNPNMGCLANFMDLCENVTAPYAAFCDGDDYWTDENKLQKQFDFMEKNKDVNVCAHRVSVNISEDDSLYNYYKKLNFQTPLKAPCAKKITIQEIIQSLPQTSSIFIRWKKIKFPKWAKKGIAGDFTIVCLQLGDKNAYILNETMSCYRKNATGVSFNKDDIWQHFIKTRPDYFRFLPGIIEYLKRNYNSYGIDAVQKRLWLEITNYANAIIKTDNWECLLEVKKEYPDVYEKIKNLLSEYKYRLQQIDKLGLKQANLLRRNSTFKIIKPILKIIYTLKKIARQFKNLIKNIHLFLAYWFFALVPKKKNLIVFAGFMKKNYMDNTKYLYEYIIKNHPEIEAVWLTRNKEVRKKLKENKMPVHRMNSPAGTWTMIRANAVVLDHWKICDLDNRYGFNAKTKIIQLWHGNGFKNMKPEADIIKSTTFKGVRLSSDITCQKNDNLLTKIIKKVKYIFIAPFREMFENYFLMFSPGPGFDENIIKPWKIKAEAISYCGYSKHEHLFLNKETKPKQYKIVYAPTYRDNGILEKSLIDNLISNFENLNNILEKIDAYFTIRLHPHTWRNYNTELCQNMEKYKRIELNTEKDFDQQLYNYSLLITDYSSLGMEFPILDRPVLYLASDYAEYAENEASFNMPFYENCAGKVSSTWEEINNEIVEVFNNPNRDRELRVQVLNKFFPEEFNSIDNSKKIVEEIKQRLKIRRKNG